MAMLTVVKRKRLKRLVFGLPKERKYPMPDREHAMNVKARALQQFNRGKLSLLAKERIDRKADRLLKQKGRRVKSRQSVGKEALGSAMVGFIRDSRV